MMMFLCDGEENIMGKGEIMVTNIIPNSLNVKFSNVPFLDLLSVRIV